MLEPLMLNMSKKVELAKNFENCIKLNGFFPLACWINSDQTDFGAGPATYDLKTSVHSEVISGVVVAVSYSPSVLTSAVGTF